MNPVLSAKIILGQLNNKAFGMAGIVKDSAV